MQLVDSKERQTVKVWEVEEAIAQEQVEQTRKRQRRTVITDQGLTSSSEVAVTEIPYQDQVTMAVPSSSSLHFYFFIGSNGTILRIGSLYSLDFCKGSVFICTSISRNKDLFKFKFLLCSVVDKKVESIDRVVSCTVNNVAHVSCQSDVIIGSKGKGLVDKVICEGWDRVLFCQVKNAANFSYLLDLRKSCLANQIRQGVYSGISRTATRPAQPIHLGIFDPMHDSKILGLTGENHFQVSYSGRDLAKLDSFLGANWDVKILEPGNPCSHFKYVCRVKFFVHRPSMSLRLNFVYSESNYPFTVAYRSTCSY